MATGRGFAVSTGILGALSILWMAWAGSDRVTEAAEPLGDQTVAVRELGARDPHANHGNLLGIQPWLQPGDYANTATLTARLDGYLAHAKKAGLLGDKSIAIFPEYTGTWLIAANEKRSVYSAATSGEAMQTVALSHLPQLAWWLAHAPAVAQKTEWALFTLKGAAAAKAYQKVFGELAQRYQTHIVAGSIVLPEPALVDGQLTVRPGGTLYNVSALFGPDGRIVPPLVRKVSPIADELKFLAGAPVSELPVFTTPAGKLAILICADAWYPSTYARLNALGAELLAVPSYSTGNGVWANKWGGYNGGTMPTDVAAADVGALTEGQAWLKYAMPGRAPAAGIRYGLNVFLRGNLWDLGSDGATIHVSPEGSGRGELVQEAVLTSLWLGTESHPKP